MAEYTTLTAAMAAGDELAEVEIRYRLLAEVFREQPNLRANLNPALERAKAEIMRLRAVLVAKQHSGAPTGDGNTDYVVVQFDASRFRRSVPN